MRITVWSSLWHGIPYFPSRTSSDFGSHIYVGSSRLFQVIHIAKTLLWNDVCMRCVWASCFTFLVLQQGDASWLEAEAGFAYRC